MISDGSLRLVCWIGAALAVVAYFAAVAVRPTAIRMLNGSGLFLTGMALAAMAGVVTAVGVGGRMSAAWAVLFLWLAVLAQGAAALRNRRAWDGTERRTALQGEGGRA